MKKLLTIILILFFNLSYSYSRITNPLINLAIRSLHNAKDSNIALKIERIYKILMETAIYHNNKDMLEKAQLAIKNFLWASFYK